MTSEDLVIADLERSVAIAGIMGGATSEVSSSTEDILLESAHFAPVGVLRTARRLELRTEASTRFERGADPEAVPAGGGPGGRADAPVGRRDGAQGGGGGRRRASRRRPPCGRRGPARVLGYPVSAADAEEAFGRLGLPSTRRAEDLVEVEVPGYRWDLRIEVDLIEEIVRVQGYDRVGDDGARHPSGRRGPRHLRSGAGGSGRRWPRPACARRGRRRSPPGRTWT